MARGSSQSQSSSSSSTSRPGVMAPRGSAAATAGMRRRRLVGGSSSASASVGSDSGSNMLRFYTDDAPGLKISPTVVLVMSLCFIGFVTALHVFGKLYREKVGVGPWVLIGIRSFFFWSLISSWIDKWILLFFFGWSSVNDGWQACNYLVCFDAVNF